MSNFPPFPKVSLLTERPPPPAAQRRREHQIGRMVRRWKRIAPVLDDDRYTPVLRGLSMVTLLLERGYEELEGKPLINPDTGEFYQRIDVVRRLVETQKNIAHELGLTPSVAPMLAKSVSILDLESFRAEEDTAPPATRSEKAASPLKSLAPANSGARANAVTSADTYARAGSFAEEQEAPSDGYDE